MRKPKWSGAAKQLNNTVWFVKRQRTAGAYIPIKICQTHEEAVEFLKQEASENPEYPYDGSDAYNVGASKHNMTRYRIVSETI